MEAPVPSQTDRISFSEKSYLEGLKYYANGEVEKAKEAYKNAISSCTSKDANLQFQYYVKLMGVYMFKNEYGDALSVLKEYEEKDLIPLHQKKLNVLSTQQSIYISSKEFEKALKSNLELYDLSIYTKDRSMEHQSLMVRVNIFNKLGKDREAETLMNRLLNTDGLSRSQKRFLLTQKGINAFYKNDFQAAIDNYKKSLKINKNSNIDGYENAIAMDYANIAEAYIELEKYEMAQKYLDSFRSIESNKVDNDIRRSVFKYELRLAKRLNLSNERIDALIDKTTKEQDALYKNRFDKELESLTEEKQKSEQLLKEKQQAEIEKLNFRNKALLVGSVFVILILAILFVVFKQKRDHEIKNLKNQQRLLRAQMNPHFIFNVLSSIQNLVKKDAKAASKFITKFSRLLRTVLENSRQNFVPLEDEIEVLKNYLDLQKLRFPDLFEYQIDLDDVLEGSMIAIPPMLIQPFVENAIEHGFKGMERPGLIEIRLTSNKAVSDSYINCCIVDDGIGYQMNPTATKKSASVELISSFIKKATGTAIRISYSDKGKSTGTVIQFKIPTN
jgi:tetratricopeptide (TPR) repeat protein